MTVSKDANQRQQDDSDNIGNQDSMIESIYRDMDLPVALTMEERLQLGEELAQAQEEAEKHESKKSAMDKEYKGLIENCQDQVSALARLLRVGKITKKVQCREVRDYRLGWLRVVRMDDGTELSSRPMTADERQMGLGL